VGASAHLRFFRIVAGVTSEYTDARYRGFVQASGTLNFCVSVTAAEQWTATVNGRGCFSFFAPTDGDWGLGAGVGTPVFKNVSAKSISDPDCPPCSLQTCPSSVDQFLGPPTGHSLTAQFDASFDDDSVCESCLDIGGSQKYKIDRTGSFWIPAACGFDGTGGGAISGTSAYYKYCEVLCNDGDTEQILLVNAILGVATALNGQCLVWATAELAIINLDLDGMGGVSSGFSNWLFYGTEFISTTNLEGLPPGKQSVELISIDEFNRRKDASEPIFKIPINCGEGPSVCGPFPDEFRVFIGSTGDKESQCADIDDLFWWMGECCTPIVSDPVSGLAGPATSYYVSKADLPSLDITKTYQLQVYGGATVCAYGFGEILVGGPTATVVAGPFDACTDCLTVCAACCDQYIQTASFTLPTINNPYNDDPDCAGIYAAYNALYAGRPFAAPMQLGACTKTVELGPFNYTTSGGCATGTDGLVTIQTTLQDNGDGTFSVIVSIRMTGSGGLFADFTYTYTQTGCLNCISGSYTPTGVNNLGASAAPSIGNINLLGVDCSEEGFAMSEMARPQTEEEAFALAPGTKFMAPDGSIRVV